MKEGLEEFDFIYDKFQQCDQPAQKEKLEGDLKKEIKKLQRHREQIKIWLGGSEVKDKTALSEHRRLIETEMERFKDVEKAMKTKAFSNEALASTSDNMDPKQREKIETCDYIQQQVEELQRQIEATEVKIDSLGSSNKKKKVDANKQSQINTFNESIDRHKWHISMLESMMRHLQNDNIDVDMVNDLKEDIEYYVESNQDPNFVEDDTFYDVLGLEDLEDSFAVIPQEDQQDSPSPVSTPIPVPSPAPAPMSAQQQQPHQAKRTSPGPSSAPVSASSTTNMIKKIIKKREEPVVSLANQLQQTHLAMSSSSNLSSPILDSPKLKTSIATTLKPAPAMETPKLKYSTVASQAVQQSILPQQQQLTSTPKKISTPPPILSYSSLTAANTNNAISSASNGNTTPVSTGHFTTNNNNVSTDTLNLRSNTNGFIQHSYFSGDLSPILDFEQDETKYNNLPNEISKYVKSLQSSSERIFKFIEPEILHVPSKKSLPPPKICKIKYSPSYTDEISSYLESSLLSCPDSHDSDKPFKYEPLNPFVTQFAYPNEPLIDLFSPSIMAKLDIDTLQYLFYYHGSQYNSQFVPFSNCKMNDINMASGRDKNQYVQWLAACELKKRGWKFYSNGKNWVHESQQQQEQNDSKVFDWFDSWTERSTQLDFASMDVLETGF